MKVGSIVLSTNQGLGYLAKDFYSNGIIDEVLVKKSVRFKDNMEWYPESKMIGPRNTDFSNSFEKKDIPIIINFLSKIDVLFLFEIPFYHNILSLAKTMGVKTILMPMYESTPFPIEADLYVCPSKLDLQYYKAMYPNTPSVHIPVPVPNEIIWKKREKAKVFVHNAGNGGAAGRNGTEELIEAMKYVKNPIKLIIRSQKKDFNIQDSRIEYVKNTLPFNELWQTGDVFIFPEKFNGLSLPLQEAFASGMLVMTTSRFPNTDWLPCEPLIPTKGTKEINLANIKFDSSILEPKDIAKKIDEWYDRDIEKFSLLGREFCEQNSWDVLKQKYQNLWS